MIQIKPIDIDISKHLFETFGHYEYEAYARFLIKHWQKSNPDQFVPITDIGRENPNSHFVKTYLTKTNEGYLPNKEFLAKIISKINIGV